MGRWVTVCIALESWCSRGPACLLSQQEPSSSRACTDHFSYHKVRANKWQKKTAAPTGVRSAYVNFSHSMSTVYFPINNVKQHQYLGWKPTRKPKGTMVRQQFQPSLLFTKDLHCSPLFLPQGFGPQAAGGTFEWKLKVKASWKSRATLWGPAVLILGIFHGIVMLVLLLSHSYIFCDKRELLAQDVLDSQLHCFPGHI